MSPETHQDPVSNNANSIEQKAQLENSIINSPAEIDQDRLDRVGGEFAKAAATAFDAITLPDDAPSSDIAHQVALRAENDRKALAIQQAAAQNDWPQDRLESALAELNKK